MPELARTCWLVLATAVVSLGGCGYTTGSLYTPTVSTVAVEIFENQTFRRGLEVDLTEAVKRQLRIRTPYRQVPAATAESTIQGTIIDVEERVLSEGDDDEVLEERVTVTVRVDWVTRDGEVLAHLPRVRGSADVATGRGEGLALGTGEALTDLAERIVLLLEDRSW